jgi:hypothetical protein
MAKRGVIIFIVILFLAGCSSGNNTNSITDFKAKISEGANLSTSVNYDIVKDKKLMNEIAKSQTLETPIMIRVYVETVNRGRQPAKSVSITFNDPTPFLQKSSTGSGGATNGVLDKNATYDYYFTYTFANESDLESFIKQASISLAWTVNQTNNEIRINLPSKPVE